jgi:hypothetical protein
VQDLAGGRNAAAHLCWATLLLDRAWQMPEAALRGLFGSFCPVSGAPLLARDGNRYQMTVAAGAGGELRTGLLQLADIGSVCDAREVCVQPVPQCASL